MKSKTKEEIPRSVCQNCGIVVADKDLQEVKHLYERVAPDEEMPSGECPECGAVCHPTEQPITKRKPKREVYSAFILHEDQTWEQPSFSVPAGTPEPDINRALLAKYDGFFIAGLQEDTDASCVERLDITP